MAAHPPVAQVLKVEMKQSLTGQNIVNLFHFHYEGATDAPTLTALAGSVSSSWHDTIQSLQIDALQLNEVKITDLTSSTSAVGTDDTLRLGQVTSSAVMPSSIAAVVSHKIARRYRGGHPRTYLAGFPESNLATTRQWSTGFISSLESAHNSFISAVLSAASSPITFLSYVNVSYFIGKVARAVPYVDQIESSAVQPRVCQQRRRLGALLAE